MATENKKSIYIQDDNIDVVNQLLEKTKKKSFSFVVNKVLEEFRKCKRFASQKYKTQGYVPIKVYIRAELLEALEYLEKNFDTEAVIQLVNQRLIEEFVEQSKYAHRRRKFPDRLYSGDKYLDKLAEKLKSTLNMSNQ